MNEPDTALAPSSEPTGTTVVTVELTIDEINILLCLRPPEYRFFVQSDCDNYENARTRLNTAFNTAFKSYKGEDSPEW